ALSWCFNEPWPSAANNSIVNRPAKPKAAYFAVREACRPTLLSARIPHFQWSPGDLFTAEIWLLHDAPRDRPEGEMRALLHLGSECHELLRWNFPAGRAHENLPGPVVRVYLPPQPASGKLS